MADLHKVKSNSFTWKGYWNYSLWSIVGHKNVRSVRYFIKMATFKPGLQKYSKESNPETIEKRIEKDPFEKMSFAAVKEIDLIDEKMEFYKFTQGFIVLTRFFICNKGNEKLGWLVNIHETLVDDGVSEGRSGIDLYFLQEDGIKL